MGQPGGFNPRGEDWIAREFADLKREIRELKAANPFAAMGITPVPDGIIVDGSEVVNGPLTVNGAMAVTGALSLPAGIIDNDALANPLTTGSAGHTGSNQAYTTTPTVYGAQEITVPAGFTRALVMNGVSGGGTNTGAGGDYIYIAADIDGSPGGETPTYAAAGFYASASAFGIRTLAGLTGGQTITVGVQARTGSGPWAAAGPNVVNINALALFYR